MIVTAIVAAAENGTIGRKGGLPWHLPDDMKFFQRNTTGHHVIMGRKNWESIPQKFRPLKDRTNVVITRQAGYEAFGAVVVGSLEEALALARFNGESEAFVIGGGEIYAQAVRSKVLDRILFTRVHAHIEGDTRFPDLGPGWHEVWQEHHADDDRHAHPFTFTRLERTR